MLCKMLKLALYKKRFKLVSGTVTISMSQKFFFSLLMGRPANLLTASMSYFMVLIYMNRKNGHLCLWSPSRVFYDCLLTACFINVFFAFPDVPG